MRKEGHLHDQLRSDLGVKNTTKDHGDRKSKEPHLVDVSELNRVQTHLRPKLGKNSGPDTE